MDNNNWMRNNLLKEMHPIFWYIGRNQGEIDLYNDKMALDRGERGELKQWQYLDEVLMLGVYIHDAVEQLDKLPFHLKIVKEIWNYWNLATKNWYLH